MASVIQRDASPPNSYEEGLVRSKAKMPAGMTLRQWIKGPGLRYLNKKAIWSYTAPVGANVGGTQSGNSATHFNNPPSGPPTSTH